VNRLRNRLVVVALNFDRDHLPMLADAELGGKGFASKAVT
jgi:hypothetical protein